MRQTPASFPSARALALLRAVGDSRARFRAGQEEAVRHVYQGNGRLLVVRKTGWGKSFVYFIATKLLREAGLRPALLVSPLLALMRNQIAAAERMGVRADTINSDNAARWLEVEAAVRSDEVDIVLIAPETLRQRAVQCRGVVSDRRSCLTARRGRSALHLRLGS